MIIGVNKRFYPTETDCPGTDHLAEQVGGQNCNPPPTVVVLVAGEIGDYAAYCGHGSPEFVAARGDKISFEEACCHFPGGQLQRELYRD